MFLHLGFNNIIFTKEIETIINLEKNSISRINKEFLDDYKKLIVKIGHIEPKSFVLTNKKIIYLSPIDSETLIKRIKEGYFLLKFKNKKPIRIVK